MDKTEVPPKAWLRGCYQLRIHHTVSAPKSKIFTKSCFCSPHPGTAPLKACKTAGFSQVFKTKNIAPLEDEGPAGTLDHLYIKQTGIWIRIFHRNQYRSGGKYLWPLYKTRCAPRHRFSQYLRKEIIKA